VIVLDCSFFLSNIFPDEENPLVSEVFGSIERAKLTAIAPNLFLYETYNGLITAVNRKRIKKAQVPEYLKLIIMAPVTFVESGLPETIITIAFSHKLSYYDATYLELALRRKVPLVTLDEKLRKAAIIENVAYGNVLM